uniref:Uncharacterized protein n=1 Tax=Anopheles merus TaxID=30066 RepID=A0A182VEY5_ANOME
MESKSPRQNRLHVPIHTYDFKLDKYRLNGMNGQLALVQALVLGAHRLDPQCPVAQVAQMLDQKPFVAAVRGEPDPKVKSPKNKVYSEAKFQLTRAEDWLMTVHGSRAVPPRCAQ